MEQTFVVVAGVGHVEVVVVAAVVAVALVGRLSSGFGAGDLVVDDQIVVFAAVVYAADVVVDHR